MIDIHIRHDTSQSEPICSIATSIDHLPPEILATIFAECIPSLAEQHFPSSKSAPLVFTLVCRRWRVISTTTPQLWTSLSLHEECTEIERHQRAMKMWLERSASLALSLRMPYIKHTPQQRKIAREILVDELAQFVRRCKTLQITMMNVPLFERVLIFAEDAIQLRELSISLVLNRGSRVVKSIPLSQTIASRLQNLTVEEPPRSAAYLVIPQTPSITHVHLRQLKISKTLQWDQFLNWISHCPVLQDVSVSVAMSIADAPTVTVVHNNLRRLIMDISNHLEDDLNSAAMHDFVRLPSLVALSVRIKKDARLFEHTPPILLRLAHLAFSASSDLTHLVLRDLGNTPMDSLEAFLRCFAALESLAIVGMHKSLHNIMLTLTVNSLSTGPICTKLANLIIDDLPSDVDGTEDTSVSSMVCSRYNLRLDSTMLSPENSVVGHFVPLQNLTILRSKQFRMREDPSQWTAFSSVYAMLSHTTSVEWMESRHKRLMEHPGIRICSERGLIVGE